MANCPECESTIVDSEPFCPVCGIALAPLMATKAETQVVEEEFDSTIMMSPDELKEHVASIQVGNKEGDDPKTLEPPVPERAELLEMDLERSTEKSIGEIPPFAFEKAETSTEMPSSGTASSNTMGGTEAKLTADHRLPDRATSETIGDEIDEAAIVPDLESDRVSDIPASSEVPRSSEIDPGALIVEPDPRALPEPETPSLKFPGESIDHDPQGSPDIVPSAEHAEAASPEIQQIEKPSIELPLDDFASSNPIYDSVRIVAAEIPESQDYVSTRIPSHSEPLKAADEDIIPNAEMPSSAPIQNDTASNIGMVDTDGRKSSKLKPLVEGSILNNRYEIVRKIGGGGMGAVYLASDNNLGGVLRAVKEMVQAHIEEEQQEKSINDFKRESMILSSLDHPSIPTIFDYFYDEAEGRFYLVMKYISGGDLSSRLRSAPEGKIDELTVTEWAIQVIDVLNYLHNQPSTIVYRDLKPSNIMIDGNSGRVMLIDFGIARSISHKEEKGVTAVGTMGYAPPELFSGNVEPRSDIYSLGSTMFHLLTGADPQSNPLLIFDFQKNPRPRQINPRLTDQIEMVLMRSVEYNADSRFPSAADMQRALEQHVQNLRSGNVTYGVSETPVSVSLEDQFVFCGFCGQRIVATDMFCAFCGAKQPIAQQGVHSGQYIKAAVTAKLLIEGTSELPMPAFSLQKDENLVGRRDPMSNIFPEVDLSKFDPQTKISRRHARIWRSGDQFLLEDLGSSNGTALAIAGAELMRLVPHKPQQITHGDRIKIGDATLHFIVD